MTREEVIKELEKMKKFNYTLAPLEVFDMAIKALWAVEHMPTTKNDLGVDCISRAELFKTINACDIYGYKSHCLFKVNDKNINSCEPYLYLYYGDVIKCIKNLSRLKKNFAVDCIDRKSIEYYSWDGTNSLNSMYARKEQIDKLPPVVPQESRWIPVSEKLPEIHNDSDYYLVTLKLGGVHIAIFTECDGESWWTSDDVIAWMPLPQAYKAESEG